MRTVALLLISMALAGCSRTEPIRIGFLAGLSGRVADLGAAGRNGAMLAVEQRNAAGGVKGRQLELVVRDDGQDPETAVKAVKELIGQQVELIVGPMTSSIAMAILPEINLSKTILLSPTVTSTALTGKNDNLLRVIDDTRSYASKSARYQLQELGHRSVAVLYDQSNAAYSESWLADFVVEFERLGGKVLSTQAFRSGSSTPFSGLAREALAARPEVVLVIANAVDAAMIFQQVRKIKPGVPLAASEWASTERFAELAGASAEGAMISQFIDRNDSSARYRAFSDAYRERFGHEPGFAGLAGYDAAQVAVEAYQRRKPGSTLKQTILSIGDFAGAQQQIRIDPFGDANRASYLTEVHNGSYRTLE